MRTTYYLGGKRVTKKYLVEFLGSERLDNMTKEAKINFLVDPLERQDYFLGSAGMLTIKFS